MENRTRGKLKVAIAGFSGYTGLELYQMLRRHPGVDLVALTSEKSAGETPEQVFTVLHNKTRTDGNEIVLQSLSDLRARDIDTLFMCLPHQGAANWIADSIAANTSHVPQVIDLSADFRLKNPQDYDRWYGFSHPSHELLENAIYGLTELNRDKLSGASLIANPGCYPTCVLLPLLPLLRGGVVDASSTMVIDAKSGVSGAGRKATLNNLFVEANENISPYGLGNSHRHVPEITQGLKTFADSSVSFIFSPHLVPLSRGMIATSYLRLAAGVNSAHAQTILEETYADAPFVHILKPPHTATIAHVARTNTCAISVHSSGEHLIIVSAIDNLLKGASGQAMQNFNLSRGFAEHTGITS